MDLVEDSRMLRKQHQIAGKLIGVIQTAVRSRADASGAKNLIQVASESVACPVIHAHHLFATNDWGRHRNETEGPASSDDHSNRTPAWREMKSWQPARLRAVDCPHRNCAKRRKAQNPGHPGRRFSRVPMPKTDDGSAFPTHKSTSRLRHTVLDTRRHLKTNGQLDNANDPGDCQNRTPSHDGRAKFLHIRFPPPRCLPMLRVSQHSPIGMRRVLVARSPSHQSSRRLQSCWFSHGKSANRL